MKSRLSLSVSAGGGYYTSVNDLSDQQLLRNYSEHQSEPAFAELVRRHVDLVYTAALRMVCDSHLAEDVTQGAFVALARNSPRLTDRPALSGWLHCTAHNLAANAVRSEVRRRSREQESVAMNELLSSESDAPWEAIAPHLDAALGELNEADRDALLLRYFEKKSAQEMAGILGISDEAAQKRVSRAVERLREYFSKHQLTIGASGLAVLISANAVQSAPAGLAAAISAAALFTGTACTTATATGITVTKTIAMTVLQKTLVTLTIVALAGAGIYEAHRAAQLRALEETIQRRQAAIVEQLQRERDEATNRLAGVLAATSAFAPDKVPFRTDLPKPSFVSELVPINVPNLEPKLTGKRPDFMVPPGLVNLAKGKKVTASDSGLVAGTLDLVTDGDKEGGEGSWVELAPGKQWVQIDLGHPAEIYVVFVWHFHAHERVYHDVVVQVSDDPAFETDVKTIYDNSSAGTDRPYIETYQGKLIDAKGVHGRYVRLYSHGNTTNQKNHYIEVEVWGKPVGARTYEARQATQPRTPEETMQRSQAGAIGRLPRERDEAMNRQGYVLAATSPFTQDQVVFRTDLPNPLLVGTPVPINVPNLEPKLAGKRPDFMVPLGLVNLAKGKKVTASDSEPVLGTLGLVTDGDKEGGEGSWVELAPGQQWVQIDLENPAEIYVVLVWHFHSQERVYRDVVVQVSDDPAFEKDVKTIYDNSSAGTDRPYIENYQGKLIDAKGVQGRYVRLYSNGNTTNKMNHYIEVEVWGKPTA